jgi:flagellar basal-body rod protein FlgB
MNVSATNPAHFSDHSQSSGVDLAGHKISEKDNYDTAVSGNSVSIEDQMVRMSENATDYDLTLNLMKKYVAMYRESLGRR